MSSLQSPISSIVRHAINHPTCYLFGCKVTCTAKAAHFPLYIRVPEWATRATIDGKAATGWAKQTCKEIRHAPRQSRNSHSQAHLPSNAPVNLPVCPSF